MSIQKYDWTPTGLKDKQTASPHSLKHVPPVQSLNMTI